jgi:uncharacterized YccA/Bax inhibitor family protein
LVASEEDAALRAQMVQAVGTLRTVIAGALGMEEDDPRATILQATLWGLGINNLLMGNAGGDAAMKVLVDQIREQTGLGKRRKSPKRKKGRR